MISFNEEKIKKDLLLISIDSIIESINNCEKKAYSLLLCEKHIEELINIIKIKYGINLSNLSMSQILRVIISYFLLLNQE